MEKKNELYRVTMSKKLHYTHSYSADQALIRLKNRCKKLFGFYKFTDFEKQLENKSWTKIPF